MQGKMQPRLKKMTELRWAEDSSRPVPYSFSMPWHGYTNIVIAITIGFGVGRKVTAKLKVNSAPGLDEAEWSNYVNDVHCGQAAASIQMKREHGVTGVAGNHHLDPVQAESEFDFKAERWGNMYAWLALFSRINVDDTGPVHGDHHGIRPLQ
jgi:hypothetical protein